MAYASINDYGTREYKQPNGLAFTAWSFSDEFGAYLQTLDGYMIYNNIKDNYYYYQTINTNGDFVVTKYKVGIDNPAINGVRNNLLSTTEWRNKIRKVSGHGLSKMINRTTTAPTSRYLKIILVEFSDIKHQNNNDWPKSDTTVFGKGRSAGQYPAYTAADFTNMLFSNNYYKNINSPDGEPVYGSMRDYYQDMANGISFSVNGNIVNNMNGNYPIWVNLGRNKGSYYRTATDQLWLDAIDSLAKQQNISVGRNGGDTVVVVIYAGNMCTTPENSDSIGLNPRAIWGGLDGFGKGYVVSERTAYNAAGTKSENKATFAHIGTHCHEFGHCLNLYDSNEGLFHGQWSLMGSGNNKGSDNVRGNCPSPISPIDRNSLGWLTYTGRTISGKNVNYQINSSINSAVKIDAGNILYPGISDPPEEYYVLENKFSTGNDNDWNRFFLNYGLLIWRYYRGNPTTNPYSIQYLVRANGYFSGADADPSDPFPGTLNIHKINDFSSPSNLKYFIDYTTKIWLNSNIQISNISNSGSTMTADISTYWYGTLSESQTWSGDVKIGEDLTIPSGVTLTLNPGTRLLFSPGVKLYVNGILNVSGNSSNVISFTRSGSTGTWGGIIFSGSGHSTLNYCKIEYVNGTAASVINSTGYPYFTFCTITNCTTGIRFDNSGGNLVGNLIRNNTTGVEVDNYASPAFGLYSYTNFGCGGVSNNKIRFNSEGVYCGFNSTPAIGHISTQYFFGNCLDSNSNYNLHTDVNSIVHAENIWWGANPRDNNKIFNEGGTAYTTPYCTSAPTSKYSEKSPEISEGVSFKMSGVASGATSIEGAKLKQMLGDFKGALSDFYVMANSQNKEYNSDEIYLGLLSLFRDSKLSEIVEYLENINSKSSSPLLESCIANCYAVTEKTDMAIEKLDKIKANYPKTRFALLANVQKFYQYYFKKSDKASAEKIYNELVNDYKDDRNVVYLASLLNRSNGLKKEQNPDGNKETKTETPVGFSLSNYPNPFNPSTIIRYSIPQNLHVKLVVYDVTGKEVKTLVDETKQAGSYTVEFIAGKYASGVYYYKLEAGDYKNIQKMVLVK